MGRALYLGIDLGTTNSAACVFDGEQLIPIRGASGGFLTPSVVRIDARAQVTVGAKAYKLLHKDPGNTRAEFKRLMGSEQLCSFAAAGLEKRPEELAAEVLRSLRKDVEAQLGISPTRAVIAVPALFELPQIRATSEAARLAGFEKVETIQEPVASALASGWSAEDCEGPWLVYDLGGGTFDASLLETQDGLLRIVGHDGDNFLGGRDFDLGVANLVAERLATEKGVRLERSNRDHASAYQKLKILAEEAKIELSRAATTTVLVEDLEVDGEVIEFWECTLTQEDLDHATSRLVERSVAVCERLLRTHGVKQLARIVLVGGPTLMPSLRRRLNDAFGAPFGAGLDPMLLVAHGASLFAATAGIDARPMAATSEPSGPRLWLQYPAMTPDTAPFLVGRVLDAQQGIEAVRVSRQDGAFSSDWVRVESDGTFATMLELSRRSSNRFAVEVRVRGHETTAAHPAEITIVHGVSIGEPPLPRTIGIARSDNTVAVYFERGTPLPMRKTFTLRTVETVSKTATDFALKVPIVQGDFPLAHLCRLVGVIEIPSSGLKSSLAVGSAIELTMEVDRGGALSVQAHIPDQGVVFDRVEQLVAPATSVERMGALILELQRRAVELRAKAFREGTRDALLLMTSFDKTLGVALQDLEAAKGGDGDASEKARRGLLECDGILGDVEAQNAWPELARRLEEHYSNASEVVEDLGNDAEKRGLSQAMAGAERALRAKAPGEVERQIKQIESLARAAFRRHPDYWVFQFDAISSKAEFVGDSRSFQALVQKGHAAETKRDLKELERIVRELWRLHPTNEEDRALAYRSGVR